MLRTLRTASACLLLLSLTASPARADERGPNEIRVDVGGALSFRRGDDRDRFGFGGAIEYERRIVPLLGVGARVAALIFPYDRSMWAGSGYASYLGIGPNLRLHLTPSMRRGDLWIAAGGQMVISGGLVRAGIDGGLGFDIGLGRGVAIGPFARYLHVFQPNGVAQGGADGRMLFFGVSISWGHVDGMIEDETEEPPTSDRDGDGVLDDADACPDVAASTPDGCPVATPPSDRDGDGVLDNADACPDVAAATANGCPEDTTRPPPSDRDGDGVIDSVDACPDVPAPTSDGCPATDVPPDHPPTHPGDRDHDHVDDDVDACPDEHARTADGCPHPADRDGDGVPDASDGCPDVPGQRTDGCADEATSFEYHLHFDSDAAALSNETVRQLHVIRDRMRAEPRIEYVVILGHADVRGDDEYNRDLSLRRARAVLEWLVRHGISRRRLEARGVGSERALVQGDTAEDLAPNRRVELYIVRPPVDSNP